MTETMSLRRRAAESGEQQLLYISPEGASFCLGGGEAGSCMGLSNDAQCGCGYAQGKKVPRCSGHCIVQCWNVWGSRNFWPQECMGENLCTCGRQGAICS